MNTYKWTVEIEVDATIVADGFDLDDDRAQDMVQQAYPYLHGSEIAAKVMSAPPANQIRREQGYKN